MDSRTAPRATARDPNEDEGQTAQQERHRADDLEGQRSDDGADAALDQSSKQGLFNTAVEPVETGLKPGVSAAIRDAQSASTPRQPELREHGRDEHDRGGHQTETELICDLSRSNAQPRRT